MEKPGLQELLALASGQRKSAVGENALYELLGRVVDLLEPRQETEELPNAKAPTEIQTKIEALRKQRAARAANS